MQPTSCGVITQAAVAVYVEEFNGFGAIGKV